LLVMARFKRAIQYAAASRLRHRRLWNTGSPGQVCGPGTWVTPFGDMGNTSTAWNGLGGRHAVARGVTHGPEERVHWLVPASGGERAGALPPFRDKSEGRLQVAGQGDRRGDRGGLGTGSAAAAARLSGTERQGDRDGCLGDPG